MPKSPFKKNKEKGTQSTSKKSRKSFKFEKRTFKPYKFSNPVLDNWEERFENLLKGKIPEQTSYFSLGPYTFDSPEALYKFATDLIQQGVFDVPIGMLLNALEINPDFYMAWHNLGAIFTRYKLYNRAVVCFQIAISIKSDYYISWINLGVIHFYLKEPKKAIKTLEEVLKKKPDFKEAWETLAGIYKSLNDQVKARHCIQKANQSTSLLSKEQRL